jgi:hypothetical protein
MVRGGRQRKAFTAKVAKNAKFSGYTRAKTLGMTFKSIHHKGQEG